MTTPPPYSNISGISKVISKDTPVSIGDYAGNARPGDLIIDLESDPPVVYVGSSDGSISPIGSGGPGDTGNVTFSENRVIGSGNDSGDGNGFSTLELVPDSGLYNTQQYLVIDPTFPSHIHIRAGGPQDASTAELFLGGEKNHVRISDGEFGTVRVQHVGLLNTSIYSNSGEAFTSGTWEQNGASSFIQFTSSDTPFIDLIFQLGFNENNYAILYYGDGQSQQVTYSGASSSMGNPVFVIGTNEAPPSSPTILNAIEVVTFSERTSYVQLDNRDVEIHADDDVRIDAGDQIRIISENDNVIIIADNNGLDSQWTFLDNGMMLFPQNGWFGVRDLVPASSVGTDGDKLGMIAFDSNHIYYCVSDYTDGNGDIWKRTAWSEDAW